MDPRFRNVGACACFFWRSAHQPAPEAETKPYAIYLGDDHFHIAHLPSALLQDVPAAIAYLHTRKRELSLGA